MAKCSFCGETLKPGTGKMYVKKDGKILYFDSNKCEKNMIKLGRNPRKFKWTKNYQKGGK
ncbi:MAG: 50S ribosomal protein L24e [Candidatus Woesearchaeota archaeon]